MSRRLIRSILKAVLALDLCVAYTYLAVTVPTERLGFLVAVLVSRGCPHHACAMSELREDSVEATIGDKPLGFLFQSHLYIATRHTLKTLIPDTGSPFIN